MDKILFVDTELTCWDKGIVPEGQRVEIIEIGIAELDMKSLEISRSAGFYTKPVDSKISRYCEELTGISDKKMKSEGTHFHESCNRLKKQFGSRNKTWLAWGSDQIAFQEECKIKKIENPFSDNFINFSTLSSLFGGVEKELNLYKVMEIYDVKPFGREHSGVDDAINTASLFGEMMRRFRNATPDLNLVESKTPFDYKP